MRIQPIFLTAFVAMASANIIGYNVGHGYASPAAPAAPTVPIIPFLFVPHAAAPQNDSKTDAATQIHVDPIIAAVYDFHKTFLENHRLKPPYHYSYGYEVYNWKTGLTQSHYEIRYGDLAIGTYILSPSAGSRTIVDYTVDTPNGFYGVVHRDFKGLPRNFGYARIGGPLAFASHPSPETYASRTTLLLDPEGVDNSSPLAKTAYANHNWFVGYLNLESPFRYSAGHEVKDSQTGRTTSQYETYYDVLGEGSFTQVEADGTRSSIDYSISPEGFAVTSPTTFALKDKPLVHPIPAVGYASIYY